jgi:hypothetical protein
MIMLDEDLRHRVKRIVGGDYRTDDLDRLFLGVRDRAQGRDSVREVGDFIAHRGQRERGLSTQQSKDVFLSFRSWLHIGSGRGFTLDDIRKVAEANLRTVTNEQLKRRTGLIRSEARSVLKKALRKLELEDAPLPTRREKRVVDYLGSAFIWNPAFTDVSLMNDLCHVLVQNGLIVKSDLDAFRQVQDFLALHVITIMHGATIVLDDHSRASLNAGHNNDEGFLEVKALLRYSEFEKPVTLPFCLF